MRLRKKKTGLTGVIEGVRPYAESVGARTGPLVDQAAERVGPAVEQAQQRVSDAVSNAAVASEPYRQEASRRGRAAMVALRGGDPGAELRMQKRRRTRKVLVFGGLTALALGAGVAYWMSRTAPPSPWQPEAGDGETSGNAAGTPATTSPGTPGTRDSDESTERPDEAGQGEQGAPSTGTPSTDGTRPGDESGSGRASGDAGRSSNSVAGTAR